MQEEAAQTHDFSSWKEAEYATIGIAMVWEESVLYFWKSGDALTIGLGGSKDSVHASVSWFLSREMTSIVLGKGQSIWTP